MTFTDLEYIGIQMHEKRSVPVKRTAPFFMRRSGRFYFSFFSSSRFLEINPHLCFTQSGDLCGSCGVLNR